MFSFIIYIFFSIVLNIIVQINSLVELPIVEDNNIAIAEKAIRNTVNNLFAVLRIEEATSRPRLKQFSTIHDFFVSITLTDCNNLKEIAKLTRVNNIDNNTEHFIAQINEVLNEDDKSYEANDTNNAYVAKYIDIFIKKLKDLKDSYVTNKNAVINSDILKVLESDKHLISNITEDSNNGRKKYSQQHYLSDYEFWQPSGRRIYQGIRTSIKTFPFMASIQFFKKFQCAGSIIKNDLVITSSSCLQLAWNTRFFRENPAFLSVQVGSDFYETDGDNIAASEIYFHPDYDPKILNNNLAIIRLARKIIFSKKDYRVRKIDFDKKAWGMPINIGKITLVGWGAKDRNNIVFDILRNKLSYAELDYYPLHDCQEHYSEEFVTKKNFCGGFLSKGSGACNRDAGGPAIIDNILMGVVSFGSPICGAAAPTVFTKIGFYSDWIEKIMAQAVPTVLKFSTTTTRFDQLKLTKPKPSKRFSHTPLMDFATTLKPIPISEIDHLRIAKDQGFQDFLATIFKSEEMSGYFDLSSSEIEIQDNVDKTKTDTKKELMKVTRKLPIDKPKDTKQKITTTTDSGLSTSDEAYKWKGDAEEETIEATTGSEIKITVIENASNDDDKKLEGDIMSLIDDLDLDKILSLELQDKNLEAVRDQINKNSEGENDEQESSSSTSGENLSVSPKNQNVDNLLSLSEENKENVDEGLSIQPFKDLTFRDRPNNTRTPDTLSEAGLFNIISLAIEEETKRHKKNHYVL